MISNFRTNFLKLNQLSKMHLILQDCQDRMQILEDSEKIPLVDDTSNELCTQRDLGGDRVRITCDFSYPITVPYPPEQEAKIQLPDLQETISVAYPYEVFFALANCQREETVRAEYRISVNRRMGYMRYYYFADVPDNDVRLKSQALLLALPFLFWFLLK